MPKILVNIIYKMNLIVLGHLKYIKLLIFYGKYFIFRTKI